MFENIQTWGAIATIIATIIPIYLLVNKSIKSKIRQKTLDIKIFQTSDSSDDEFITDVSQSKSVKFIGTTHGKLHELINRASEKKNFSLCQMEVYYSGINSHQILGKTIKDVTISLTNLSITVSNLLLKKNHSIKVKVFYQKHFPPFAGCLIDNNILYVVHYTPTIDNIEANGITIRIDKKSKSKQALELFDQYFNSLNTSIQRSIEYTQIYPTIWDKSVEEWIDFEKTCNCYQESINSLSSLIEKQDSNILEIGSGTGILAQTLITKNHRGQIVLTDFSGEMINYCRNHYKNNENISVCFYNVYETKITSDFNTIGTNFDYIISHLSFPFAEDLKKDFPFLLSNLQKLLSSEGRLIFVVHNTVIDTQDDTYNYNEDPFINALIVAFEKEFGKCCVRKIEKNKYKLEEFISLVEGSTKLQHDSNVVKEFVFPMQSRISMWTVPAILNSIIDHSICTKNDEKPINNIFQSLKSQYGNYQTAPIITTTLIFCMKK